VIRREFFEFGGVLKGHGFSRATDRVKRARLQPLREGSVVDRRFSNANRKMNEFKSDRCGSIRLVKVWCIWLVVFSPTVMAQTQRVAPSGEPATAHSTGLASVDLNRPDPSDLLREIDDPGLGRRWLLYRDPRHPQGPGRLVAVGAPTLHRSNAVSSISSGAADASRPVIRAGDRVILEENTPIVEARLEAIALVPAFRGSPLKVRLILGGKVLAAVAIAPGRVELAAQPESQP
jgi:hypothetical protein